MKKIYYFIAKNICKNLLLLFIVFSLCIGGKLNSMKVTAASTNYYEMRGLSATSLVEDMGAGWNLGNSLESEYDETNWKNPKTTKAMIDAVAAKGFKTLRIPVRWDDHYSDSSSYTISKDYLARVEEVVKYGLDNDMYVIINVHHNDLQNMVSTDYSVQQRVKNELTATWKQVGTYFKNYGDKLIFEVNNEPRNDNDWNGGDAFYQCVNEYNEAGRSAIRSTGGNNSSRLILLPTYCASSDYPKLNGWKNLSNDNMIAVSIHAYLPFDFAFEGNGHSNWTDSDYESLSGMFKNLKTFFVDKGIPVVIGEFGATNKNNTSSREKYAYIYPTLAKECTGLSIPCIWWDNNRFETGSENFGIFNRNSCSFTYGGIADALVSAYNGKGIYPVSGNTLFQGESSASSWEQAVSVATKKNGGTFDASNIKSGGYFYVEYSGTKNELELIMQSWSGGAEWGKVAISDSGTANGHYFAKFSYDNCVTALGTNDFANKLDKIHVGATTKKVTVYSVVYKTSDTPSDEKYVSLFEGTSTTDSWGQAVSIMTQRNNGPFNASTINSNGYFYVEYSGTKDQVEFILQSWSGGAKWAKVSPYETGSVNGHYYAKYNYSSCVSAFGTSDFANKLDQLHVGAKESSTTVYALRYYSK